MPKKCAIDSFFMAKDDPTNLNNFHKPFSKYITSESTFSLDWPWSGLILFRFGHFLANLNSVEIQENFTNYLNLWPLMPDRCPLPKSAPGDFLSQLKSQSHGQSSLVPNGLTHQLPVFKSSYGHTTVTSPASWHLSAHNFDPKKGISDNLAQHLVMMSKAFCGFTCHNWGGTGLWIQVLWPLLYDTAYRLIKRVDCSG